MFPALKNLMPICLAALALTACGQITQPVTLRLQQPVRLVQPVTPPVSLVLRFIPGTTRNQRSLLLSEYNLSLTQVFEAGELYVVLVPPSAPLSLLTQLKADPRLSMVESAASLLHQPDFSLSSQPSRLLNLLGKSVDLEGIYHTGASGASLILAEGTELDLVNAQGLPLQQLPGLEDRSRVRMTGLLRNGVNSTSLGLFPRQYQRI